MSFRNKGYWRPRITAAITQQTHNVGVREEESAVSNMTGPHAQLLGLVWKRGKIQPWEQRVKSSLSQNPVSYVQYKLQSSREKGVGYIVQAVVTLLGFGK